MTRDELIAVLRTEIDDERVLAAIASVPREAFVEPHDRRRAWSNKALGIGCGQTISQPFVVARMCEVLRIEPGERVLDVGSGSGYHAAILAALGARVTGVEIHPELVEQATERLRAIAPGVRIVAGDGRLGYPPNAPYDAICVAAAAGGEVPPALLDQLAEGGRLVCPVRTMRWERLVLVRRTPEGLVSEDLEEVRFVPLV